MDSGCGVYLCVLGSEEGLKPTYLPRVVCHLTLAVTGLRFRSAHDLTTYSAQYHAFQIRNSLDLVLQYWRIRLQWVDCSRCRDACPVLSHANLDLFIFSVKVVDVKVVRFWFFKIYCTTWGTWSKGTDPMPSTMNFSLPSQKPNYSKLNWKGKKNGLWSVSSQFDSFERFSWMCTCAAFMMFT